MQGSLPRVGRSVGPLLIAMVVISVMAMARGAEEKADDAANVRRRTVKRETTPLGGSIEKRLLGNRDTIVKSPHPYAERSFASRLKSVFSSMRERHERAFSSAEDESGTSATNLVQKGVGTNEVMRSKVEGW
ncbi:MAG: hypothetical protein N2255_09495 [Kiritimatiellae bacterium]|nr:hypothetical protein [Kiritimatiellia bacterium]